MPTTLTSTREWLAPYFNRLDDAMHRLQAPLAGAVVDYVNRGVAAANVEPGNGTRYLMVFTSLATLSRPAGADELGWYDAVDAPTVFGGDMLVSMPDFHRCTILSSNGFHVPDYIEEKLSLGAPHAAVVAAFVTLFDEALHP